MCFLPMWGSRLQHLGAVNVELTDVRFEELQKAYLLEHRGRWSISSNLGEHKFLRCEKIAGQDKVARIKEIQADYRKTEECSCYVNIFSKRMSVCTQMRTGQESHLDPKSRRRYLNPWGTQAPVSEPFCDLVKVSEGEELSNISAGQKSTPKKRRCLWPRKSHFKRVALVGHLDGLAIHVSSCGLKQAYSWAFL